MSNWQQLDNYFGNNSSCYFNECDVLFNKVDPNLVLVEAVWPGYTTVTDISIVYLSNNATQFFTDLCIKKAAEIQDVTPDNILQLYLQGKAIVVCSSNDESLEFEIQNERIYAKNGDSDMIHAVGEPLVSAEDYILYTRNYFLSLNNDIRKGTH